MKKIVSYIPVFVITVAVVVGLAFSESERKAQLCAGIVIDIDKGKSQHSFIVEQDVLSVLKKELDSLKQRPVLEIAIHDIEEKLSQQPSIKSCNVFFTVDGILTIQIQQRTPILRVESTTDSYYIDEQGRLMPLSDNYTARTIIANGAIESGYREKHNVLLEKGPHSKLLQDLFAITQKINSCSLLSRLIEQIYVSPEQDYILVSKVGPPIIHIGKADNLEYKFKNLRAFYHSNKVKELWDAYKEINIKYRNQIICTKQ